MPIKLGLCSNLYRKPELILKNLQHCILIEVDYQVHYPFGAQRVKFSGVRRSSRHRRLSRLNNRVCKQLYLWALQERWPSDSTKHLSIVFMDITETVHVIDPTFFVNTSETGHLYSNKVAFFSLLSDFSTLSKICAFSICSVDRIFSIAGQTTEV